MTTNLNDVMYDAIKCAQITQILPFTVARFDNPNQGVYKIKDKERDMKVHCRI